MNFKPVITAVALISLMSGSVEAASRESKDWTLMLVPVQERAVDFAMETAKIRPVYVVSYQRFPGSEVSVLHVWNPGVSDWMRTSLSDLTDGSIFVTAPVRTVLWGTDLMIPKDLQDAQSFLPPVTRLPTLGIVDAVNTLAPMLAFRPAEWRAYARRYGFELNDANTERRRWGRFGPPDGAQRATVNTPTVHDTWPTPVAESRPAVAPAPAVAPVTVSAPVVLPRREAPAGVQQELRAIEEATPAAVTPPVDPLPENK